MESKVDKNGFGYYDKLPDGYRLAIIDDFHFQGKKKIGLQFLIRWHSAEYYQICKVSETLTSKFLIPFIESSRVYVKS
jgi:hypothetical protein